ncbi:hypothetical protein Tco_1485095 [Tanacetum coccineum]
MRGTFWLFVVGVEEWGWLLSFVAGYTHKTRVLRKGEQYPWHPNGLTLKFRCLSEMVPQNVLGFCSTRPCFQHLWSLSPVFKVKGMCIYAHTNGTSGSGSGSDTAVADDGGGVGD